MSKPKIAVDTNVIIAAVISWHEHHKIAQDELNSALERGDVLLPKHVLLEAYSVLTRLPAPHRLSPEIAHQLLDQTFKDTATIVSIPANRVWPFLSNAVSQQISGGRIYDAFILAASIHAHADELLTFNAHHFDHAPSHLKVRNLTSFHSPR